MFLVLANEAFGYTHEQTLDSSLVMILALLREHGYMINERNRYMRGDGDDTFPESEEWTTIIDFETGKPRRIRKVDSV